MRIELDAAARPVIDFLDLQAELRGKLPLRTLHVCTTCRLEKIVNPDFQRLQQKNRKMRILTSTIGGAISTHGISAFLLVGRLAHLKLLDPDFVCPRCQGMTAETSLITFCPKCGERCDDAALRQCRKCSYDLRTEVTVTPLWTAGQPLPPPSAWAAPSPTPAAYPAAWQTPVAAGATAATAAVAWPAPTAEPATWPAPSVAAPAPEPAAWPAPATTPAPAPTPDPGTWPAPTADPASWPPPAAIPGSATTWPAPTADPAPAPVPAPAVTWPQPADPSNWPAPGAATTAGWPAPGTQHQPSTAWPAPTVAPLNLPPPQPAVQAAPPPAWHPDPQGRHEFRWWDGKAWSEHVSDRGIVAADPIT